tara:strand:- start:1787 stop:1978 length:192 start_codon:yes stop_codon:yes gene_type:complete
MKTKGVIRLKVNNEEVNLTTDCSRNAFMELTKELYARTDIMIQSMYFDECLTDKELKILTNLK